MWKIVLELGHFKSCLLFSIGCEMAVKYVMCFICGFSIAEGDLIGQVTWLFRLELCTGTHGNIMFSCPAVCGKVLNFLFGIRTGCKWKKRIGTKCNRNAFHEDQCLIYQ